MDERRDPLVTAYLDTFLLPSRNERKKKNEKRIKCCGSSRSFFCPQCLSLLVDPSSDNLPPCIRDASLRLPFHLRIVLDDQRTSATGLHAMALLGKEQVSLYDISREDDNDDDDDDNMDDCCYDDKTYVLFPSSNSVPLSSVVKNDDITTLIVLDCKWTRTARTTCCVSELPHVHLSHPPLQSQFWKSHTVLRTGCLSTIEAIYYAAMEVVVNVKNDNNNDNNSQQQHQQEEMQNNLIHLLYIFGRQRAAIQSRGIWKDRKGLPYTEIAKEEMRELRRGKKKKKQTQKNNEEQERKMKT